jgi:hypothetical protein
MSFRRYACAELPTVSLAMAVAAANIPSGRSSVAPISHGHPGVMGIKCAAYPDNRPRGPILMEKEWCHLRK